MKPADRPGSGGSGGGGSCARTGWPNSAHASLRHSQPATPPANASVAGWPQVGQSGAAGVMLPTYPAGPRAYRRGPVGAGPEEEPTVHVVRINHVSVHARDLATSVGFYRRLLGAEPVPTLNFGVPVQWLALGDAQLHLFERDVVAPRGHHFAVTVADLVPVHRAARELGALDAESFGHHLFLLPGDVAQMYVRDPAGNLVEVDAAGASSLPAALRAEMRDFTAQRPQTPEHLRARLPLAPPGR